MSAPTPDPSSHANTAAFVVEHYHLDLKVNFVDKVLEGTVALRYHTVGGGADALILDVRDIEVLKATVETADASISTIEHSFGPSTAAVGGPLSLILGTAGHITGGKGTVTLTYKTSPSSSAIQFLEAAQTAGKKHPYMFTQCQAIHARSLLPCQDTPSIKSTYSARITVPAALTALMSATGTDRGVETGDGDMAYTFNQRVPVPSYLIAIVVGELESREIGPRSKVWSEPSMVDAGAHEFADTEKFIATGEDLLTPYAWGRYDILLLPPSFPYGGMENPMLTFVTPTLLAGDRSLAGVVAHEIAHSWMGNLVTSATWEHFWLNEGFTVFIERKILGRMYGEPTAQLSALQGLAALDGAVADFGPTHPHTCLVTTLANGVDPDDAFSRVPYEKGFNFLYYLQGLVGGGAVFEPFLKAWVETHAQTSVTTEVFVAYFNAYFKGVTSPFPRHPTIAIHRVDVDVDWKAWLNTPGDLPVRPTFDASLAESAERLARTVISGATPSREDIDGYSSAQLVVFLHTILSHQNASGVSAGEKRSEPESTAFDAARCEALDTALGLSKSKNSEVRFKWLMVQLKAGRASAVADVVDMVTTQGRMKFTRPLYRELVRSTIPGASDMAKSTFAKHKSFYHPICQKMVASDLGME